MLRPLHLPQRQRLTVLMQCVIWLQRNALLQALVLLVHGLLRRCCCHGCRRGGTSSGGEDLRPFVIICSPRSGSTLLVEALDAHPRVVCRGEVLNPVYEVYGDVTDRAWWRVRLHWLAMFTPPLWPQQQGRLGAIGAKLFHVHASPGALTCGATVSTLLDALPTRPLPVLLYRRCMLSSYLSLCRAFETDRWFEHIDDDDDDDDATSRPAGSAVDRALPTVAGLMSYCETEVAEWSSLLSSLAVQGWRQNQIVVLCYEDDIDSPDGWRQARETLGARLLGGSDHQSIRSGTQQQHQHQMEMEMETETQSWLQREHVSVVQRKADPVAAERRVALLTQLQQLSLTIAGGNSSGGDAGRRAWRQEDHELPLPEMIAKAFNLHE